MKTVSTHYSTEEAGEVADALVGKQIPCEIQKVTEESGIDSFEVVVADEVYDQACDAVEKFESEKAAAVRKANPFRCPKCSSSDYEQSEDAFYQENGLSAMRCEHCGCVFAWDGKRCFASE